MKNSTVKINMVAVHKNMSSMVKRRSRTLAVLSEVWGLILGIHIGREKMKETESFGVS